jgi:hypothetical protein
VSTSAFASVTAVGTGRPTWVPAAAVAVLVRPSLWVTAVRQIVRLAPERWWQRRPYLPLPDADYLAFRLTTMYGGEGRAPEPADVVAYLTWCRAWPTLTDRPG